MSKLKAGDVTMWATTTLMDLVGPYAQATDCPLEKWFRDKIYQLFEGTAQVQRLVISRMQARAYQERFAAAAEIAKQAMDASSNGASANGAAKRSPPRRPQAIRRRCLWPPLVLARLHRGFHRCQPAFNLEAQMTGSKRLMLALPCALIACASAVILGSRPRVRTSRRG